MKLFNKDWEFAKQDINSAVGPGNIPESNWGPVDLPHDWLIYDTNNLYEDGIGWYRKSFFLQPLKNREKVFIRFDGVYMDSSVFVNNKIAGEWKYGYSAFEFDITDLIIAGKNEIMVKVVHQAPNSRWYSGAGIYRNVWLKIKQASHLLSDGIYISANIQNEKWTVSVDTGLHISGLETGKYFLLRHSIIDNNEEIIAASECSIAKPETFLPNKQTLIVSNPRIWDIDSPNLYSIRTELISEQDVIDSQIQRIGFRTVKFDSGQGFFLNGRHLKLQGVCMHHDLGCLGSAVNESAIRRQLILIKRMGANAVRTSHNMPAREFMELADELGILVVSEAFDIWEAPKNKYDYSRFFKEWRSRDVESWIRRDRNHPSLIMWSIGNEIADTHSSERGLEITRELTELVRNFDPRGNAPVTIGSNYMPWENAQKCADVVKLAGYNYAEKYYSRHHKEHPDWIIYGSETSSIVQSRGIYHFPASQSLLADDDEQCSSLGNSSTSWGAKNMEACIIEDRDAVFSAGQFLWSGFDYIGEPTPYHTKNSYFGQIDTCGFPKDSFYFYQANWTDYKKNPMVHILPYWDFNEGQLIDIRVFSNAPKIELFFNGGSLGAFEIDHKRGKKLIGEWRLPYTDGSLKAIAYDEKGKIIAEDVKTSFGEAAELVLKPEKTSIFADGGDLAFIEIYALDKSGNTVENASNRIEVEVGGAGRLIGLDNGDSADYDQYKGTSRRLFSGKLLAVVAPKLTPGKITISVSSRGLIGKKLSIESKIRGNNSEVSAIMENPKSQYNDEIPVRKISLRSESGITFNKDKREIKVFAKILPENATYRDLEWRVTNNAGIDSSIAEVEAKGAEAVVKALGDGAFRLRCMGRNGTDKIRLISQIEFNAEGLGKAYINPYQFVCAGLYNKSNVELGNGNERGIATSGEEISHIGFKGVDFGEYGSDMVTIPIFVLDDGPFPLEIWQGMPGEKNSEALAKVVYHKPSVWNVYQEETYALSKKLKGVATICFVVYRKAHIKGFIFQKFEKAFQKISAMECNRIYGDFYQIKEDAVENIGNNVSLEFDNMDFGKDGVSKIAIHGRSRIPKNAIHLRFSGQSGEETRMVEFPYSKEYITLEFPIEKIQGEQKAGFIFLPGSKFDFKWFQFKPGGKN